MSDEPKVDKRRFPHSPERRAKISAATKGRKKSEEHKAKIGASVKRAKQRQLTFGF